MKITDKAKVLLLKYMEEEQNDTLKIIPHEEEGTYAFEFALILQEEAEHLVQINGVNVDASQETLNVSEPLILDADGEELILSMEHSCCNHNHHHHHHDEHECCGHHKHKDHECCNHHHEDEKCHHGPHHHDHEHHHIENHGCCCSNHDHESSCDEKGYCED